MNSDAQFGATVEQWLSLESQIVSARKAASASIKPMTAAEMMQLSGLETMRAMFEGSYAGPSIGNTLSFTLVEVDLGRAVFQGMPSAAHCNPMGGVHGGWYATILDSALGCAVHTMMSPGMGYTTAELSVNIVKAISPKVQRVRAEGKVLHCGRQLATAEAKLFGPDGTLFAHSTTTCLVFPLVLPSAFPAKA